MNAAIVFSPLTFWIIGMSVGLVVKMRVSHAAATAEAQRANAMRLAERFERERAYQDPH